MPARLSAQSIVDLEAEGQLPPGAMVERDGDLISRIESPWVNSGESDIAGFDFRARANWKTDWVDLVLAPHWSLMTQREDRVGGEIQPGDYPRHRVHTSLRASRGGFTANWSVHAVSSYWNTLETARYEAWTGHDITFRWRNAVRLERNGPRGRASSMSAIAVRPPTPRTPACWAQTRRWIPFGDARCS